MEATERPRNVIEFRRPQLYRKQREAIFGPERMSLIEASTKTGKTLGCIAWLTEEAVTGGGEGRNYWWGAPVSSQADIAFVRLVRMLPQGTFSAIRSPAAKRVILPNGAIIWFKSGEKPDNLYGEDVYGAVIDEASRFKEASWHAVRTTLTKTQGRLRIIGNVKGRKNWFYNLARRAQLGAEGMSYHKLIAHDAVAAGILSAAEVEAARRDLPERWFRELYLAEPSDDGGNPFGLDHLRECVAPMSDMEPVCWGWDLAKSQDWTVGIALDKYGGVCRLQRFQRSWRDTAALIVAETNCFALVDSTGVGDPILEQLQLMKPGIFEGYQFTGPSKQQLMEGLMMAVHQRRVSFPEGPILFEMESFEYEYRPSGVRYSAPEGIHDDAVCSLALAVMCASQLEARQPPRARVMSY